MEESINKGIGIAVGLIATLIIASLIFVGVRYGRSMASSSFQKASTMSETAETEEYTQYIGQTVSGNQVVSLIGQWQAYPLCVQVKTNAKTMEYNYKSSGQKLGNQIDAGDNAEAISKAKTKGNDNYINPNGKFECTAKPDNNGVYNVIVFTQN